MAKLSWISTPLAKIHSAERADWESADKLIESEPSHQGCSERGTKRDVGLACKLLANDHEMNVGWWHIDEREGLAVFCNVRQLIHPIK